MVRQILSGFERIDEATGLQLSRKPTLVDFFL